MSWSFLRRQTWAPLHRLLRRPEINRGVWRLRAGETNGHGKPAAELWLESGWVIHAELDQRIGEPAAVALLFRPRLRFFCAHGLPVPQRTLHCSTEDLLRRASQGDGPHAALAVSQVASPPL
jgi:hypothetical protein